MIVTIITKIIIVTKIALNNRTTLTVRRPTQIMLYYDQHCRHYAEISELNKIAQ